VVRPSPGVLEHHLIPTENWPEAPFEARHLADCESAEGVPTGIAVYEGRYYVIQSSGQGPYIIWEQP
jgi:hypothetical protein